MKNRTAIPLVVVFLAWPVLAATPVTEERAWTETYAVATTTPSLFVRNIWGSVRVRDGAAGEISVSATELRSAPDQERLERSFEAIKLNIDADNSGVSLVVGNRNERWHRMDECDGCRVDYQFEIHVPPGTVVDVGTVLDGRVDVQGVRGMVSASNVNGPIMINDLQDCETINSVNGRIELQYSQPPVRDCSIETINGDITLEVPLETGLDVALDLFNGDVASEFPVDTFTLPATVENTSKNGRTQYRIQQQSGVRIGAGGPIYSIASMNGDVRIQKHQ